MMVKSLEDEGQNCPEIRESLRNVQIRQFRDEGQISFNSCNDQFVVKCLGLRPTAAVQDVSTTIFMSQKRNPPKCVCNETQI